MIGWLIFAVYVLGYLLTWRMIVHHLAWEVGRPSGEDLVFAMFFGSCLCLIWPVVQIGRGVKAIYTRRGDDILTIIEPRSIRKLEKQKDQARRIEELERELKLR